jgi:hypothetical protein
MNPYHGIKYAAINWRDTLESYSYHTWLYDGLNGKYSPLPTYNGPNLRDYGKDPWYGSYISQAKFTAAFGYGSYSAGHLDLTKGAKSFGTLGQDETPQLASYYSTSTKQGVYADWNGFSSNSANPKFLYITFLADAASTGSETAQAKI